MLNGRLEKFATNNLVLSYTDEERKKIQKSIASLTNWLNNKSDVLETMVFGSWTRNTILPRRYDESSDIDILVVFNGNVYNRHPESCRNLLRTYAAQTYSSSYVRKDAPAVKLELGFIKYDLVPAVSDPFWGQLCIPNTKSGEGWMSTFPRDLDPKLERVNMDIGGNVVRHVIRLCKYMNKCGQRTKMSSYELESYIIGSIAYLLPKRTYDCFLGIIWRLVQDGYVSSSQTMTNILNWVEYYRKQGDWSGQITWIKHLLPDFSA